MNTPDDDIVLRDLEGGPDGVDGLPSTGPSEAPGEGPERHEAEASAGESPRPNRNGPSILFGYRADPDEFTERFLDQWFGESDRHLIETGQTVNELSEWRSIVSRSLKYLRTKARFGYELELGIMLVEFPEVGRDYGAPTVTIHNTYPALVDYLSDSVR